MSSAPAIDAFTSPISLTQLQPRRWATVTDVETSPSDLSRLTGLGICTGRRLQMVKAGDPMILQVYGTRIGLSARLAALVRVVANVEADVRG
jgi:Fe2+ transport system protein FeoA